MIGDWTTLAAVIVGGIIGGGLLFALEFLWCWIMVGPSTGFKKHRLGEWFRRRGGGPW